MITRHQPMPSTRELKREIVLFDEDYRSFVWHLLDLLDRERAEVYRLKQELKSEKACR